MIGNTESFDQSNNLNSTERLFLCKFKVSTLPNVNFPFLFRSNPNVYSVESQIPYLFIKSKKKRNKFNETILERDSFNKNNSTFPEESLVKKWFLVLKNEFSYGPYNSNEIYLFLNNISKKKTGNFDFLVVNSEDDIFYNPGDL